MDTSCQHVRDMFRKESKNKDQVKETIVQGITDDISITIYEYPKKMNMMTVLYMKIQKS